MLSYRALALATTMLTCPLAPAFAQTAAVPLAPISVEDRRDEGGSLTVPSLAKQRETINRNAGSVGFIDSESTKERYSNNLRDVLQDAPGVFVENRYGQEIRLSVRASGIARSFHTRGIDVLQDGIPTNLADGSGDFYQIDPLGIRSTEIYKGGNALAMGGSQLGGVVNFVTPTAYTALAPNVVRLDAGSFGTAKLHAEASRIFGNTDVFIGGTFSHADGWRAHETQNNVHLNANIGHRFNENLETRFYFGLYHTNQKLPGTLTYDEAFNNPTKASAAALAGDQARNTYVERFANRTTWSGDTLRLDVDTWAIHKYLNHPIFQVIEQNGWTYGIAPKITKALDLGGHRNEVIVGLRYFGGSNNADQFINNSGNKGLQTSSVRQLSNNYEVFAENRFYIVPELALVAGAKAFAAERRYVDNGTVPGGLANTLKDVSKSYSGLNPKVGVLWTPQKDVQVFANVTRSTDVPDFTDLAQIVGTTSAFVPLEAQKAWTVEAGTRGKLGRFGWDVTLYRSQVTDQALQYTVNPSIPASTFNAPNTVLQGLELGGSVDLANDLFAPGDRLTFRQIWNWSDFRFQNDPQYANNRIPGVPEHVLRSSLTYKHAAGVSVTPNATFVPTGAFVDYANAFRVPGYALFGINLGVDLPNGWSGFLDVRNIADTRYISDFATVTTYNPATYASYYPGTGRAVYAGLRGKF